MNSQINAKSKTDSPRGTALFMVLLLTTILFLLISTMLLLTMTEINISDVEQRSTQAFYAAESAFSVGIAKLRQTNGAYRHQNDPYNFSAGNNPGFMFVQTTSITPPALYRFLIRGTGSISGVHAVTTRKIEREVAVKPFVLFAENEVTLNDQCAVVGNVHGNTAVNIAKTANIEGDATSNQSIANQGTVTGTQSKNEPEIVLPPLLAARYTPTYRYKDASGNMKLYQAQPLSLISDTIALSEVNKIKPPAPSIELYSGFPSAENPAGIFYLPSDLTGNLVALHIEGTLLIPTSAFHLNGIIRITPVEKHYPAIISTNNLELKLIGNLEQFAAGNEIPDNRIQGLIYTTGTVEIDTEEFIGELMTGSIFAQAITLTDVQMAYQKDPTLLAKPPPGIDFIDIGEWREIIEPAD